MAITKLIVGGFKSLKEVVEIPLAPITLVFGPNSAGKSVIKDALVELKRRLTATNTRKGIVSILRMVGGEDTFAHQLPRPDELEEAAHTRLLLGCEIDEFLFYESVGLARASRWNEMGRGFYQGLHGKCVTYHIVDEGLHHTCAYSLEVDGFPVIEYTSDVESSDSHPIDFLENLQSPFLKAIDQLGLVSLHVDHAFWMNDEFHSLLDQLRSAVEQCADESVRSAVWCSDKVLYLRLSAYRRQLDDWSETISDRYGRSPRMPVETAVVNELVRALCEVVNELIRQTENAVCELIDIAHVSGSRQLLSEEDVRSTWVPVRNTSYEPSGFGVRDYAQWLGAISAESECDDIKRSQEAKSKDDFVNDSLSRHLFSARGYRVKAEVSVRTETLVVSRDATWDTSPQVAMQSTLYLQDEEGRCLDFNQVGSGISYVLPVLTALWGADRSLIEQPELHLHPAAQCEMGDAVIRAFNRRRFSIIETHSEHLLLRILRRIRQTSEQKVEDPELKCPPEAVVVLYFAPIPGGTTEVHRLRVTRGGDFMDRWPDGFFEERSRELFGE